MYFRLLGTNSFHVKAENEGFTATGLRCRQNLKYENFTSSFGRLRQTIALKERAASAERLFFLIQPIKSLIFGVVVAVVKSLGSLRFGYGNTENQSFNLLNEEK